MAEEQRGIITVSDAEFAKLTAEVNPQAMHQSNTGIDTFEPDYVEEDTVIQGDGVEKGQAGVSRKTYLLSDLAPEYELFVLGAWYIAARVNFDILQQFQAELGHKVDFRPKDVIATTYQMPILEVANDSTKTFQYWRRTVHAVHKRFSTLFGKHILQSTLTRDGATREYWVPKIYHLPVATPGEFDTAQVSVVAPSGLEYEATPFSCSGIIVFQVGPASPETLAEANAFFTKKGDSK